MSSNVGESSRSEALNEAYVLWDEALSGPAVKLLGITKLTTDVEARLRNRGLSEREARVLSDLAFRAVLNAEREAGSE